MRSKLTEVSQHPARRCKAVPEESDGEFTGTTPLPHPCPHNSLSFHLVPFAAHILIVPECAKCAGSPPRLRAEAEKLSSESFGHSSLLEIYFGTEGAAVESRLLMSAMVSIHHH